MVAAAISLLQEDIGRVDMIMVPMLLIVATGTTDKLPFRNLDLCPSVPIQ